MESFKAHSAKIWVSLVVIAAVAVFMYVIKDDEPAMTSVFATGPFQNEESIIAAIADKTGQVLNNNKYFWIGIEPGKNEQINLVVNLIQRLKRPGVQVNIIVDQELSLSKETQTQLGATDVVTLKENLHELGEKLQNFEKNNSDYIVVTASIYSNSLLKKNPIYILKEKFNLNPVTFSLAYLPTSLDDEKNMVFGCRTEDQTGTSEWGCTVVNKSRFARKKIATFEQYKWSALMDLSGVKDYILILRKNDN